MAFFDLSRRSPNQVLPGKKRSLTSLSQRGDFPSPLVSLALPGHIERKCLPWIIYSIVSPLDKLYGRIIGFILHVYI